MDKIVVGIYSSLQCDKRLHSLMFLCLHVRFGYGFYWTAKPVSLVRLCAGCLLFNKIWSREP